MSFEDIQTASIIRYPYLWVREAGQGEAEGSEYRPVAVGGRITNRPTAFLRRSHDREGYRAKHATIASASRR